MAYSETVFGIVAELVVEAELNNRFGSLRTFDDIVIALSLDSGLPLQEVQSKLVEKMLMDKDSSHVVKNVVSIWNSDTSAKVSPRG